MTDFEGLAQTIRECFHAYGIHSITLQPEPYIRHENKDSVTAESTGVEVSQQGEAKKRQTLESALNTCKSGCGSFCLEFTCCC